MPPRIPCLPRFGALNLCLRPTPQSTTPSLILPLTQTASLSRKEKKRMAKQEPYRWAQMQQRTAAHKEIKKRISADRDAKFGDPVRGLPTPFVESFDSAGQSPLSRPRVDIDGNPIEEPHALPTSPQILNNQVSQQELDEALRNSYVLTKPYTESEEDGLEGLSLNDPEKDRKKIEEHEQRHAVAVEAIRRLIHLENGSAKDRRHANIRRCIETFGRHQTDSQLRPKGLSRGVEKEEKPARSGPDTGSSEVQIAILTVKIRSLANELQKGRGYKDKVGKRDLRLLVHRRQKLLQYMEKKERGSERWTHMLETLGLTPATWKGQITL